MTVVTVIVTAGVCGVAPALFAASRPPGEGLKVARPLGQRRGSTGSLLASVEVSLALVLLIGVGLLVETLVHIARIPAGFDAEGVDVVRIQMAVDRYTAPADDAATDARSLTPAYAEARLNSFSNEVMSGEIGRLPIAYLPYRDSGASYGPIALPQYLTVNFVARRDPRGRSVVDATRAIVRRADPDTPITYAGALDDYIAAHLGDRRFPMLLIGILAVVSSLLALSGVYGILSFAVGRRVHEIGVRMALGARADEVVRMIVKEGAELAILGALVGVAVAMGTTRLLSKWLFAVSPTDPMVLVGLAIAMVVVASLAAWVPAHRAATIDPVEALAVE